MRSLSFTSNSNRVAEAKECAFSIKGWYCSGLERYSMFSNFSHLTDFSHCWMTFRYLPVRRMVSQYFWRNVGILSILNPYRFSQKSSLYSRGRNSLSSTWLSSTKKSFEGSIITPRYSQADSVSKKGFEASSMRKWRIFSALRFPLECIYLSCRMERVVPPVAFLVA